VSAVPGDCTGVPLDRYCNIDEVKDACINLNACYPALTTLLALPKPTHEGNTLHALRIGSGGGQAGKPTFIVIGGLHGNEWGSSEILLSLAADLLGAYQQPLVDLAYGGVSYSAAQINELLDTIDLVFLPLANPDGRRHAQESVWWWRKNRNPAMANRSDDESVGVDLNRNFNFLFKYQTEMAAGAAPQISNQPAEGTYQGPRAFSEPETRNVRWLFKRFPQCRWFVDLHCGARRVIYPWSDDEVQHGDSQMDFRNPAFHGQRGIAGDQAYREYMPEHDDVELRGLAQVFVDSAAASSGASYDVVQGFVFTPCCATSHDWAYSRHRVNPSRTRTLALAIEWHEGTAVFWTEMPKIIEGVSAGLIAMGRAVLPSP
jgi:murein tripeptide amidase MpaA